MKAVKSLFKVDKPIEALNKNKERIANKASNSKCHNEVAMSYNEVSNQLEQKYYNKASGCSVKAQEDNLFDYRSQIKEKQHANNL